MRGIANLVVEFFAGRLRTRFRVKETPQMVFFAVLLQIIGTGKYVDARIGGDYCREGADWVPSLLGITSRTLGSLIPATITLQSLERGLQHLESLY